MEENFSGRMQQLHRQFPAKHAGLFPTGRRSEYQQKKQKTLAQFENLVSGSGLDEHSGRLERYAVSTCKLPPTF